jgi:hypothetical protein
MAFIGKASALGILTVVGHVVVGCGGPGKTGGNGDAGNGDAGTGGTYWTVGNGTVSGNGLSCTLSNEVVYVSPGNTSCDAYILYIQSALGSSAADTAANIQCTGQLATAVLEFEILIPTPTAGTYGEISGPNMYSAIQFGAADPGCVCPSTGNFCGGEWNLGQAQGTSSVTLTSVTPVQTSGGTFYLPHGSLTATVVGQFSCSNASTSFAISLTF